MKLSLFIARRYLFSPKKRNAINIISLISTVGVAVGTIALIVILSVFNGIDSVLNEDSTSFTPDLVLSPAQGKFIATDSELREQLSENHHILYTNFVVEESALAKFGEQLVPVTIKGVEEDYDRHTGFSSLLYRGKFQLKDQEKHTAMVGSGIAYALNIRPGQNTPVSLYYPERNRSSSLSSSINEKKIYPVDIFGAQQDLANKYIITSIELARQLFDAPDKISRIEIRLKDQGELSMVKQHLKELTAPVYKVEDKYDLNRSFYAMMKSEKLAIFLILLFILCIASFNIVGSISMLIIDKREDIGIFEALGMTRKKLISIFTIEGNLITIIGAFIGLVIGTGICLLQEHYGLITLGDGGYMIEAYPVKLIWSDILTIIGVVLVIGFIASYFPVRFLVRKISKY